MTKAYQLTKYPKLFEPTYWSWSDTQRDTSYCTQEIIAARNRMVEEFGIVRHQCLATFENLPMGYAGTSFDHVECPRTKAEVSLSCARTTPAQSCLKYPAARYRLQWVCQALLRYCHDLSRRVSRRQAPARSGPRPSVRQAALDDTPDAWSAAPAWDSIGGASFIHASCLTLAQRQTSPARISPK